MWIVALAGEQDLATAPDVEMILTTAAVSGDPVVVDLLHATFADSSILSAILHAAETAGEGGLAVVLPGNGEVRRLFDLVGAHTMVSTFAALRDAIDWCQLGDRGAGDGVAEGEEPAGE